jgi:hypothetical protein
VAGEDSKSLRGRVLVGPRLWILPLTMEMYPLGMVRSPVKMRMSRRMNVVGGEWGSMVEEVVTGSGVKTCCCLRAIVLTVTKSSRSIWYFLCVLEQPVLYI